MRRLLLVLLAGTVQAAAESPEQLFHAANQAYQQGRFAEAAAGYEQARAGGAAGAALHYNLGNAYYKAGDVARAVLNYERALRFAPDDEDLRYNLQLARLMLTDRIEPAPQIFLLDWWDAVKSVLSVNGMTAAVLLFFALLMGSLGGMALARSYRARRLWFAGAVAGAVLLLAGGGVLWAKIADLERTDEAVVIVSITNVKNSPDEGSTDAFVLHAGTKVRITDAVEKWLKIRLADGKVGWMEEGAAERI